MDTKEFQYNDVVINGFVALFINLAILPLLVVMSFLLFKGSIVLFLLLILFIAAAVMMIPGYFSQEPNEARAMVFFGKYKGTFTETGFFWVNPFMNKKKLSLRARNLDIEPIKVNDKIGNPVLIGLVLVWKLKDTYKAMFEIDAQTMADNKGTGQMSVTVAGRMNAFEDFVRVQSDAALRQVAGLYAYDDNEANAAEGMKSTTSWSISLTSVWQWLEWKLWRLVSTIWLMLLRLRRLCCVVSRLRLLSVPVRRLWRVPYLWYVWLCINFLKRKLWNWTRTRRQRWSAICL